jgi:hypothetical protein
MHTVCLGRAEDPREDDSLLCGFICTTSANQAKRRILTANVNLPFSPIRPPTSTCAWRSGRGLTPGEMVNLTCRESVRPTR